MDVLLAVTVAILFQGYPVEPEEYRSTVDVRARVWFAEIEGEIKVTDDDFEGTTVEFDDDLDFESPEPVVSGMIGVEVLRNLNLYADFWTGSFEGKERIDESFTFGGTVYPSGTSVNSELQFFAGSVYGTYPLTIYRDETFMVDIEFGLGGKYLYAVTELEAEDTPIPFSEKSRVGVPLPVGAVRLDVHIGEWVRVEGYAVGFGFHDIRDTDVLIFEAGAEVRAYIYRGLYISAGYHVFIFDVSQGDESEGVDLEVTASGFQIGIGYEF